MSEKLGEKIGMVTKIVNPSIGFVPRQPKVTATVEHADWKYTFEIEAGTLAVNDKVRVVLEKCEEGNE